MRQTDKQTSRDKSIDVVKGIAMFLMLWGHCIQYCYPENENFFADTAFKVIYSFHMPLLMLVSGYLFRISAQKNKENLFSRKTTALAKMIFCSNVFEFIFTTVLFSVFFQHRLSIVLDGKWLEKLGGMWFLWSVLAATIVTCFIEKYANKAYKHVIIVVIGILIVAVFPNWQMNLFMYPYFMLGYYFARFKDCRVLKNKKLITCAQILVSVLYLFLLFLYKERDYIYTSGIIGKAYSIKDYLVIDCYRWLVGLAGCVAAISLIQWLCKVKVLKRVWNKFSILGEKSLQIYVVSVVILSNYLPKIVKLATEYAFIARVYNLLTANKVVYDLVFTLIMAVLYAVVSEGVIKVLEKLKVSRLVFGR